jgi:methylase of polypeptide subunit release factors
MRYRYLVFPREPLPVIEPSVHGRDDVVYDLGCGDGRIVIAAAKRCGARGIGRGLA